MDRSAATPDQRENERQLSSLRTVSRSFRDAAQDSFKSEPHAGARRERFAVKARDILNNSDLQGPELSGKLTTLFGKSKDVGLNLALVTDPARLNILLDALSEQKELRTLHITASNMGPRFQATIAALLPVIAANRRLTECNVDVRDNGQGAQAAQLIEQQLVRSGIPGSATH